MTTRILDVDRMLNWALPAILLFNGLWVVMVPAFPTLDGWAHLQTARMLFGAPTGDVFCSNPGIVPNRTGHLLLGLLQLVLPGLLAERVLLGIIVAASGLGAYALMRAYGGRSPLLLLVLPFTVNFMLALGFHNFLLGAALAFVLAAWWAGRDRVGWLQTFALLPATLLLFYTHTTALALFLLLAGGHELAVFARLQHRDDQRSHSGRWKALLLFTAACLPSLVLYVLFSLTQQGAWGDVDRAKNLTELFDLRSILLYTAEGEAKFRYATKLLLVGSMGLVLFIRLRHRPLRVLHSDVLLAVSLLLIGLYFVVPDSSGYASYITVRLQWTAVVLAVIWMASQAIPFAAVIVPVAAVLLLHTARLNQLHDTTAPLVDRLSQVTEAANTLPSGSVVLPLSFEENWLLGHIPSLLAAERDIVLLDNYECGLDYFPMVWCTDLPGYLRDHLTYKDRCLHWLDEHLRSARAPRIDRIVVIGTAPDGSACGATDLQATLDAHFHKGHSSSYTTVYERIGP